MRVFFAARLRYCPGAGPDKNTRGLQILSCIFACIFVNMDSLRKPPQNENTRSAGASTGPKKYTRSSPPTKTGHSSPTKKTTRIFLAAGGRDSKKNTTRGFFASPSLLLVCRRCSFLACFACCAVSCWLCLLGLLCLLCLLGCLCLLCWFFACALVPSSPLPCLLAFKRGANLASCGMACFALLCLLV